MNFCGMFLRKIYKFINFRIVQPETSWSVGIDDWRVIRRGGFAGSFARVARMDLRIKSLTLRCSCRARVFNSE